MTELVIGLVSAFWFGILTSISPCPLASNIVAISFVGRMATRPIKVLLAGILYTAGRALTYVALGVLLVSSLLTAPAVSAFLQTHMNRILGPILILTGMLLLNLIVIKAKGAEVGERMQKRVESLGLLGGFVLGIVFAAAFCPVSAALFFVNLISIAVTIKSPVLAPVAFGIGTGLPVLVFAVLISVSTTLVARAFDRLGLFEKWARRVTGVVFILVGIYYCLRHIFGVLN